MKRLMLAALLALLAWPVTAQAKELSQITFCGAGGCRTIAKPSQELGGGGDGVPDPAPAVAPYYTVKLTTSFSKGEGQKRQETWQIYYVRSADTIAFRGEHGEVVWELNYGAAAGAFRRAVRGLEPFPAPTITSATVGGRRVDDPATYLRLLTLSSRGPAVPVDPDFAPILLHSKRPSPWTDGEFLTFSRSAGLIRRGNDFVKLDAATADRIASGRSLDVAAGGFAWGLVSIALAFVLALALAAVLLVRRSRRSIGARGTASKPRTA